jgi:hypothetical protein
LSLIDATSHPANPIPGLTRGEPQRPTADLGDDLRQ